MQRNANSLRRKAKRTYFFERVRECERVFAPHRTRGYGRLSRRPHALFALLGATALSRTHCSRCDHVKTCVGNTGGMPNLLVLIWLSPSCSVLQ